MFKTLLKIVLVVAIAATLSFGIGKCTKDFIQPAEAAKIPDWGGCITELIIANTKMEPILYSVVWHDHAIPEVKGRPTARCGGELKVGSFNNTGERSPFRLCPGRHTVIFYLMSELRTGKIYKTYQFIVYPNTTQIVLTPDKGFYKRDYSIKPPKLEDV